MAGEFFILDEKEFLDENSYLDEKKLKSFIKENYRKLPLKICMLTEKEEIKFSDNLLRKSIFMVKKDVFIKTINNSEGDPNNKEEKLKIFLYENWFSHMLKHFFDKSECEKICLLINDTASDSNISVNKSLLEDYLSIYFITFLINRLEGVIEEKKREYLLRKINEELNKVNSSADLLSKLDKKLHMYRYDLNKEDISEKMDIPLLEMEVCNKIPTICFNNETLNIWKDITKAVITHLTGIDDYKYEPLDFVFNEEIKHQKENLSTKTLNDFRMLEIITNEKEYYNLKGNKVLISYIKHRKKKPDDAIFHENLSGNMEHSYLVKSSSLELDNVLQLVENGLVNIAICDERVVDTTYVKNDQYRKLLRNENVYLVKNFFGLDVAPNLDIDTEDNSIFIDINDDNVNILEEKSIFILIIHLGILDKVKDDNKRDVKGIIEKLYRFVPHIYITSGRGEEFSRIPESTKFINYSVIGKYMVKLYPSKLFLVRQLMMGG